MLFSLTPLAAAIDRYPLGRLAAHLDVEAVTVRAAFERAFPLRRRHLATRHVDAGQSECVPDAMQA